MVTAGDYYQIGCLRCCSWWAVAWSGSKQNNCGEDAGHNNNRCQRPDHQEWKPYGPPFMGSATRSVVVRGH
jgi:hypothetical protein